MLLPSLATAPPSRKELFTFRVQLVEAAALRRLHASPLGTSRARQGRVEGTETRAPASPAPQPLSAAPPAAPAASSACTSTTLIATCCQLAADCKQQSAGTGFTGPPHHFGQNKDKTPREKTQAELKRSGEAGFCFIGQSRPSREDGSRLTGRPAPPFAPHSHGRGGLRRSSPFCGCPNRRSRGREGMPIGRGCIRDVRWGGGRRLWPPGDGRQQWPCNGGRGRGHDRTGGAGRSVGRRRRWSFDCGR